MGGWLSTRSFEDIGRWFARPLSSHISGWSINRSRDLLLAMGFYYSQFSLDPMSFRRRQISPLFPKLMASFGREAFKPFSFLAKGLAFFPRQLLESIEPFANAFLLLRI